MIDNVSAVNQTIITTSQPQYFVFPGGVVSHLPKCDLGCNAPHFLSVQAAAALWNLTAEEGLTPCVSQFHSTGQHGLSTSIRYNSMKVMISIRSGPFFPQSPRYAPGGLRIGALSFRRCETHRKSPKVGE